MNLAPSKPSRFSSLVLWKSKMNLKITRSLSTGIMVFVTQDDEQYDTIENTIIAEFDEQLFGRAVTLNVGEDEFCQYWLSADIEYEEDFLTACDWVVGKMQDLGADLEKVL